MKNSNLKAEAKPDQSTKSELTISGRFNFLSRFFRRVLNGFMLGYWAYKNPLTIAPSNFKMLSDLLGLILAVAKEDRPRMTHIAFVHPTEGEQQIVSIWAGAGMDADPTKRIAELLAENSRLKMELSKRVSSNQEIIDTINVRSLPLANLKFIIFHRPTKTEIQMPILTICEEYSTVSFKTSENDYGGKYNGIGRLPSYDGGNDTADDYDVYVEINGVKYLYDGVFYSDDQEVRRPRG